MTGEEETKATTKSAEATAVEKGPKIISLDDKIERAIAESAEHPDEFYPELLRLKLAAIKAVANVKAMIAIEGPIGSGKSTDAQFLGMNLGLDVHLEDPGKPQIAMPLSMLYFPIEMVEIRSAGAVNVNIAYTPERLRQLYDAFRKPKSCVFDRIPELDDTFMNLFVQDGLMTQLQADTIKGARRQATKVIRPGGITAAVQLMIWKAGQTQIFYDRKNKRGRDVESEEEGGGVPFEYLDRLNQEYERSLPRLAQEGGYNVIFKITQELKSGGQFDPANERHWFPVYKAIVERVR